MRLLVLDRDGVINEDSDTFVKSLDEWIPIPGSIEAIAHLSQAGYLIAVATNQSGLARGLLTLDDLNAMHARLHARLGELGGHIEGIFFCPHRPEDGCGCRKPRPGLLTAIQARLGIGPADSLVVGDSLRDLEAAWSIGAPAALVKTGKGAATLAANADRLGSTPIYRDLAALAESLLSA